ncbi:Glycosyl hydrolase family 36 C-terminal domain-containing protein [Paenibacillus sp. yr247]|uniref:GH36 C-terminal domain-containing protein n=1 Tax=Paenibacillus sp. yr247 TaxID=1761880 RepID=UPI0008909656|nr:GH36 C-terminal domain-containing protein [Paenibacillus sp. yr247]SDO34868.1 Glycosyl hydrolase family 36 C-terminal domain-containing protein [Paenibacillus sp. yr247]
MYGKSLRTFMCLVLVFAIYLTGVPFASQGGIPTALAANSLVTRSGNVWTIENDVMRSVVSFASGSIQMTSFYNKAAGKEYLTGTGSQYLFYYKYDGSDLYANDGGWTLGTATVTDITKFGTNWGELLTIPVTRSTPQNVTIYLNFEIYNGNAGIKYSNSIQNNAGFNKTITDSDLLVLNLPNDPHTLHYVPNMAWFSTTGALAPNAGRNAITVYNTGDGWGLQPEMNWKTEGAPNRLPFASINAWSGISNVKLSTNSEALQLVLFPNEKFEYISVNMIVFKGDILDGKMAVEEHFRKRFKYHDATSLFTTNDWDYIASRSDAFFRNTVVPKAAQAGLDMVMVDDLWNTTRDTTTAASSFTTNLASLTDFIASQGLKFGLWFSMTGDNHDLGRDLADPANIEFKRSQVEDIMIPQYHLSHQMIDLTEFWPNTAATSTSHPNDSVYRKNVLVRDYMNDLVSRHPDFIGKLTSEVDIYPTQGDRNNGLLHISDNGFISANGGVGTSMKIGMDSFGYLPMNSVYYGGNPSGKMEDYYSYMLARVIKFNTDPTSWSTAGINSLRKFNDWRKSPRIKALTDQTTRPLYAGPDFDTSGSYAWMYTTEDKTQALVIATAANTGGATDVTLNLRWLDSNKTYLVEDITMDDSGNSSYAYKGKFTGAELIATGLPVNLAENTSKGKAFWLQEDNASSNMQVLYADEKITSFTQSAGPSSLTVTVNGTANATGTVIVFDRNANKTIISNVSIGAGGTGSVTISSGTKYEAESLVTLVSTGDSTANGTDAAASNGSLNYGNFTGVGDWIQYTVNVPSPGTYRVKTQVKKHPSRGIGQLYIDGTAQGSPIDEYRSAQGYVEVDLGNVTFNTAGNKMFKFQVTGQNSSSSGYGLATDYIRLTYQSPDILLPPAIAEAVKYEAENLTTTVSSGVTSATSADTAASNGSLSYGNATAVGNWIQYTVNVPSSGTYRVRAQVKMHPSRGIAQLYIDGAAQGAPIDEYQSAQAYVVVDLGDISFDSPGNKQFKFQVTGKNASSASYTLATDYISLTKQPLILENESLTTAVSTGATFVNSADSAASNGNVNFANLNGVGDWVQYTVNVPTAGTYAISARVKKHPDRGTEQLLIDGVIQGSPIDQHDATTGYTIVGLGEKTFTTAGSKQFTFQIVGKDPESASFTLAHDNIILTRVD